MTMRPAILVVIVIVAGHVSDATAQSAATGTTAPPPQADSRRGPPNATQPVKSRLTTVSVEDIHCKHCGKRLARKLFAVPGVVRVRADVAKNVAIVTPQQKKTVSAVRLWEAAEAAGFKVIEIQGPAGKMTEKPARKATP